MADDSRRHWVPELAWRERDADEHGQVADGGSAQQVLAKGLTYAEAAGLTEQQKQEWEEELDELGAELRNAASQPLQPQHQPATDSRVAVSEWTDAAEDEMQKLLAEQSDAGDDAVRWRFFAVVLAQGSMRWTFWKIMDIMSGVGLGGAERVVVGGAR